MPGGFSRLSSALVERDEAPPRLRNCRRIPAVRAIGAKALQQQAFRFPIARATHEAFTQHSLRFRDSNIRRCERFAPYRQCLAQQRLGFAGSANIG